MKVKPITANRHRFLFGVYPYLHAEFIWRVGEDGWHGNDIVSATWTYCMGGEI